MKKREDGGGGKGTSKEKQESRDEKLQDPRDCVEDLVPMSIRTEDSKIMLSGMQTFASSTRGLPPLKQIDNRLPKLTEAKVSNAFALNEEATAAGMGVALASWTRLLMRMRGPQG